MRVLLVEDEAEMASALKAALARHGVVVDHVADIADAEEALVDRAHDALLLDRQLPDGDGLTLLPRLRQRAIRIPTIVLTARDDLADRVVGLDSGADDYLAKPFAVEELMARLRALLRRPAIAVEDAVTVGRLRFDLVRLEARIEDAILMLPRRELLVLDVLARRSGRTVLRDDLERAVYGFDDEIQSNSLDAHISRLRRKLAVADAGVEIHSIRGVGYLLRAST